MIFQCTFVHPSFGCVPDKVEVIDLLIKCACHIFMGHQIFIGTRKTPINLENKAHLLFLHKYVVYVLKSSSMRVQWWFAI